jgi:cob(I)alamin adenosyltransferase
MKIYTKTGDDGTTGLFNGERVKKSNERVWLYGTVDELNASIGLVMTHNLPKEMHSEFVTLSNLLFNLGSDLATPFQPPAKFEVPRISENEIMWLESLIDKYDDLLEPLNTFILPGGTQASAFLHLSRTICRRAERIAVELSQSEDLGNYAIKFLNRLSDFLFTASRMANKFADVKDVSWEK